MNQAWSETGDRYILKLFRDYVFHSAGFDGEPIVDIAHIVQCLNKVKNVIIIFIFFLNSI
jgi:PAB-dependent poly(A)-specific ribonuclease subunit 3